MPDDFQYVKLPDGSYGKFASDASDDVIRGAIQKDFPDAFKNTPQLSPEQQAAQRLTGGAISQQGLQPTVAPIPMPNRLATRRDAMAQPGITPAMRAASPINQDVVTGLEYTPVVASVLGGAAELPLAAEEAGGYLPAARNLGRGLLKSAAGSTALGGIGAGVGRIFGPQYARTGAEIGWALGAIAGPTMPDSMYARTAIGRMLLSNEELATERAAMKLAQRGADYDAGLRSPTPSTANVTKAPMEPPQYGPMTQERTQAVDEAQREDAILGTIGRPKGPMIVTPSEARSQDFMQNYFENQASRRGTIFAGGGVPEGGRKVPFKPTATEEFEYPQPGEALGRIRTPETPRVKVRTRPFGLAAD